MWLRQNRPRTDEKEREELNNGRNGFALVMERPWYLKIMTLTLIIIAFLSALYLGFKAPFEQIAIQVIGYVVALWGIRTLLFGEVRIFPSYLDYCLLSMYVLLFLGIMFRIVGGTRKVTK